MFEVLLELIKNVLKLGLLFPAISWASLAALSLHWIFTKQRRS
jgi:hypothetical protein